jgi:rfaE bifunctional protein kinase chain/domain
MSKIITQSEFKSLQKRNNKIVLINGNFNTFHPGHLRLIKYAKKFGSLVLVAINDESSKDIFVSNKLRLENLESISLIDYLYKLNDDLLSLIKLIQPKYILKGKEFENKVNIETKLVQSYGGKVIFSSGEVLFSSSSLINSQLSDFNNFLHFKHDEQYLSNHNLTKSLFLDAIEKITNINLLIVGDSIIDRYISCDPIGMSQEEPVVVVRPIDHKDYLGGASIVALHAKSFVNDVHLYSLSGNDSLSNFLNDELDKNDITSIIYLDDSRPTTLKTRYKINSRSVFRTNVLSVNDISLNMQKKVIKDIENSIDNNNINLVIFSDFNYGFISKKLINSITKLCQKKQIMVCADSQSSSQVGNLMKYHDISLLTPTEHELRTAGNDFDSGIPVVSNNLIKQLNLNNLIVTLGENGCYISDGQNSDYIEIINKQVKDVSGAGDSLLIGTSIAMSLGLDIWAAAYFGSLFAALQVDQVSNTPISKQKLIELVNYI